MGKNSPEAKRFLINRISLYLRVRLTSGTLTKIVFDDTSDQNGQKEQHATDCVKRKLEASKFKKQATHDRTEHHAKADGSLQQSVKFAELFSWESIHHQVARYRHTNKLDIFYVLDLFRIF